MEKKPGGWRGSNGGHEERLPLRGGGGLETETRAPHAHAHAADQQEAGRGRHRRNCVRAALVLCLLTLPACMLVVWNLRTDSSPRMLFDVGDLPKYDGGDDQGFCLLQLLWLAGVLRASALAIRINVSSESLLGGGGAPCIAPLSLATFPTAATSLPHPLSCPRSACDAVPLLVVVVS